MPVYEYVALNERGKRIRGSIDADNVRAARQRLRSQKVFPTDIREGATGNATAAPSRDIKRYFATSRISLNDLAVATRQLATLFGAGLPLVEALEALADQTESQVLNRILVQVREEVEEGSSFARALGKFPRAFPSLYVNMVASGEASGTLDTVLANLADYLEAQVELRRKVWSALTYPIVMLVLCAAVIVALLVYVIPKIVEIFEKQGAVLPLPTRAVLALSHFITSYWYLLIALVLGGTLFARWYYRQRAGRERVDRIVLKLPIYGRLYVRIASARVARTLSTLLSSGVGLLTALDITRNITSNVHIAQSLEDTRTGVQEGRSLARELARSGIFPPLLSHMIAVGEKSGELEAMLENAGKAYENEVNAALSGLTALLEPLMMIFVGMIVLVIVISVLLPMADLVTVIQQ